MAKSAAERKADERERRRQSGYVLVQEWVPKADVERLQKFAARLRKSREKERG